MNDTKTKKDNNRDYFDSIDIAPTIAIVLILCVLGYGFFYVVFLLLEEKEDRSVVNQEIQIGEYTEGTVIEEELKVVIEGGGDNIDQEVKKAIQDLIESDRRELEKYSNL